MFGLPVGYWKSGHEDTLVRLANRAQNTPTPRKCDLPNQRQVLLTSSVREKAVVSDAHKTGVRKTGVDLDLSTIPATELEVQIILHYPQVLYSSRGTVRKRRDKPAGSRDRRGTVTLISRTNPAEIASSLTSNPSKCCRSRAAALNGGRENPVKVTDPRTSTHLPRNATCHKSCLRSLLVKPSAWRKLLACRGGTPAGLLLGCSSLPSTAWAAGTARNAGP